MSVHIIYYKDGAKMMRPVLTEEEYRLLRDSERNKVADKKHMVQMNYSCLPNEDGSLKGATRVSMSVGMDIDFDPDDADYEKKMREAPEMILGMKEEIGLLMLERSATKGYHIAFKRKPEMTQEENLRWASELLGVEYDKGAKDITRVFFTPTCEKLIFIDPEVFNTDECEAVKEEVNINRTEASTDSLHRAKGSSYSCSEKPQDSPSIHNYEGIPYSSIVAKWWQMHNNGQEPVQSNRNTLTFELAVNLRHICGFDRELMRQVIPCYDGFSEAEKMSCIDSALSEKRTQMPRRLKEVIEALRREAQEAEVMAQAKAEEAQDDGDEEEEGVELPKMPMGVSDSIASVGPTMAMPVITAICPAIGMLATGVKVEVHGKMQSLNLISYIAGDFASGKGSIDPVVDAWTEETRQMDKMYLQREDEWRAKKRAAKNKKEQPEEPKLPVRCLTLNNTVANLAERLANTEGKHAFSFTPEADTVAQKWKSSMSDFSIMLRQAYDGSAYEREARSADAVNVHIDRLLWNVVMCGTPDALYRVVSNYTDGFQSRIALARTPDNTFTPLTANLYVMTSSQRERIRQVAHLLPLMEGEVTLAKLEERGREWLERVRVETMKDDDKVKARQRFRICPTTMRMMTCLILCKVAELLIGKHGLAGAERELKRSPDVWKDMAKRAQTSAMLRAFDVIADYQMENALYFFRDRIENAFESRQYAGNHSGRMKKGCNDTIYERLDSQFTIDQAMQQWVAVKGAGGVSRDKVRWMLKNWRKQGLALLMPDGSYRKIPDSMSGISAS